MSKTGSSYMVTFIYSLGGKQNVYWDMSGKDINVQKLAESWRNDLQAEKFQIFKLDI